MPWGKHNAAKAQAAAAANRRKGRDVPSDRERAVAQYIVGGMTQKAAFLKAGYSIGTDEYRVLTRPAVIRYIEDLRERSVQRFDYTIENLCARLEHISSAALASGEYAPAISAVMGIARMMGHLVERSEIELHILSKPTREPTKELLLSAEEWQRQYAPKAVGYDSAGSGSPNGNSKANSRDRH